MDVQQRLQSPDTCAGLTYPDPPQQVIQRFTIFLTDEDENDLKIEESEEEEDEEEEEVKIKPKRKSPQKYKPRRKRGVKLKEVADKPLKKRRGRRKKTDENENSKTNKVEAGPAFYGTPEGDGDESDMPKKRKSTYPCYHCNYISSWKTNLEKHMMAQHTGERPYRCPHCEYASVHQMQLEKHWNTHHLGAVIHCSICPFTCEAVEGFCKHFTQVHGYSRPMICTECGRRAVSLSGLEMHMLEKHPNCPRHSCPQCSYKAVLEENVTTHLQALHRCFDCGFTSVSPYMVRRHKKKAHRMRLRPSVRPYTPKPSMAPDSNISLTSSD